MIHEVTTDDPGTIFKIQNLITDVKHEFIYFSLPTAWPGDNSQFTPDDLSTTFEESGTLYPYFNDCDQTQNWGIGSGPSPYYPDTGPGDDHTLQGINIAAVPGNMNSSGKVTNSYLANS